MPIFEYECNSCGNRFELLIQRGKKPACPQCGSKKLTKLFSRFSNLPINSSLWKPGDPIPPKYEKMFPPGVCGMNMPKKKDKEK